MTDPRRALLMDRSMGRAEYKHWRKVTRSTRHLRGPVWFAMADPAPTKALSDAAYARQARHLAIELRVHRNKVRQGLPA